MGFHEDEVSNDINEAEMIINWFDSEILAIIKSLMVYLFT